MIVIVAGSGPVASAAGMVLVGVALMVYLVNVLARLAIASQRDREREQRARDRFTRTGDWEVPAAHGRHREAPAGSVERQARRGPLGRSKRPPSARQRSEH
ncbi:MAG: hypothetical protein FWD04_12805 [Conexibacteraceae bacterium]|nr:hypothetical protein [Conexibacteraceae bacterium]